MKLLLTNDDGIEAEGIAELAKALSKEHEIMVVAPSGNRSANSHLMTIGIPMSFQQINVHSERAYALNGSPVDCVKFAHEKLRDFPFEAVISGINRGPNLGTDAMYSGTVGAAVEGAFLGYPSIAFSSCSPKNNLFAEQAALAAKLLPQLLPKLSTSFVWNVNFPNIPPSEIKGACVCRLGRMEYYHRYEEEEGGFRLRGEYAPVENPPDADVERVKAGYIAIAPVVVDLTDERALNLHKNDLFVL